MFTLFIIFLGLVFGVFFFNRNLSEAQAVLHKQTAGVLVAPPQQPETHAG